jgi:hypothetical protein
VDLRKLEGVAPDPVALVVAEQLLEVADLDLDADLAQLFLVPLEHPLKGLVGLPW